MISTDEGVGIAFAMAAAALLYGSVSGGNNMHFRSRSLLREDESSSTRVFEAFH